MADLTESFKNSQITFSIYCISGVLGNKCNCSRCRTERGQAVTPESEELSKLQSIIYQDTGGLKDTIWDAIFPEIEKGNLKPMDLAQKACERIKKTF